MPSTARGLPYPNATDPVAQGAANIQALAQAIEPMIQAVPAASATPPAAPVAGQFWNFPADAANGVRWIFAYDPTQATYKWVFVGGSRLFAFVNAPHPLNAGTLSAWMETNPAGPDIVVPRAGKYLASYGATAVNGSGTLATFVGVGAADVSTGAWGPLGVSEADTIPAGTRSTINGESAITLTVAAHVLRFVAEQIGAQLTYDARYLSLLPVAVI
jgi:hypothetical protein